MGIVAPTLQNCCGNKKNDAYNVSEAALVCCRGPDSIVDVIISIILTGEKGKRGGHEYLLIPAAR